MTLAIAAVDVPAESRPTGIVQPVDARAQRALAAIRDQRFDEAAKLAAALPESSLGERAWKSLMLGLVPIERLQLSDSELPLLSACSLALIVGLASPGAADPTPQRLAALALHHLGWVYRRQDRPDEARQMHEAAYQLRQAHGSFEEVWQTAMELGRDADVSLQHELAQHWYGVAIKTSDLTPDAPKRRAALAWTQLATSCSRAALHDKAVEAAKTARQLWREYDISAPSAVEADMKLGTTLLQFGQALHTSAPKSAACLLQEARDWLDTACEAFLAFNSTAEASACREQKDFADRLLASLWTH